MDNLLGEISTKWWALAQSIETSTNGALPLYTKFVEPLETRNIPSLLVAIVAVLLVLAGFSLLIASLMNSGSAGGNVPPVNETELTGAGLQSVLLYVQNPSGLPINGARVSYAGSPGGQSKQAITNSSGIATLRVANGTTSISVSITSSAYEDYSEEFALAVSKIVNLNAKPRNVDYSALFSDRTTQHVSTPNQPTPKDGVLTIAVLNSSDHSKKIAGASVTLYNAFSKTQLDAGSTDAEGKVVFSGLSTANPVSLSVSIEAPGYVSLNSRPFEFNSPHELELFMESATALTSRNLEVVLNATAPTGASGSASRAQTRGDIYIITSGQQVLAKQLGVSGKYTFKNLPLASSVYIAFSSNQHYRIVTPLVDLSQVSSFVLNITALPTNAAGSPPSDQHPVVTDLQVKAVDFYGAVVAGADVSVLLNGVLSPPSARSNSQGIATFKGMPASASYVLRAEKDSFVGETTATSFPPAAQPVELVLRAPSGTASISVIDQTTDQLIENANVTVYYLNSRGERVQLSQCTFNQTAPCLSSLVSGVRFSIQAEADGYYSTATDFDVVPLQTSPVQLKLFPKSFAQGVAFTGLFEGETAQSLPDGVALQAGKIYTAKFAVRTQKGTSATNYGFFVRAANATQQLTSSYTEPKAAPAAILLSLRDFMPSSSIFLLDKIQAGSGDGCSDSINTEGPGLYKWAYVTNPVASESTEMREVSVPIVALRDGPLAFEYFMLANFTDENVANSASSANSRFTRFPQDDVLGSSFTSQSRQWCKQVALFANRTVTGGSNLRCNKNACIDALITQGDSQRGSASFSSRDTSIDNQPITFKYNILNFKSDEVVLQFTAPKRNLPLNVQDAGVDVAGNTFKSTQTGLFLSSTFHANAFADEPITLPLRFLVGDGGSRAFYETQFEIQAPPRPPDLIPPLGSTYVIEYSRNDDKFVLLWENRTPVAEGAISMYVDPILPADAVFVYLNYSSSPCGSGQNNFEISKVQEAPAGCFEDLKLASPTLVGEQPSSGNKINLLKYDASMPSCAAYSPALGKVNEVNGASITIQHTCSPANLKIPITVKLHPALAGQAPENYAPVALQKVWSEIPEDSVNELVPTSHTLWAVLVNRQYSSEGQVRLATPDGLPFFQFTGGAQVFQPVHSASVKSTKLTGTDLKAQLNAPAPAFASLFLPTSFKNKGVDEQAIYNKALPELRKIAANTVYRRRPVGCEAEPTCKLKTFPLSAFTPDPFTYQLGVGYLGADGNKVLFDAIDAEGQKEPPQGIYSIAYQFKLNDQNLIEPKMIAKPLTISQNDYFDDICITPEPERLTGRPLSWYRSCLKACGDGTYFNVPGETTGTLCNGDSFKLTKFNTAFGEAGVGYKMTALITELGVCYAAGCGATWACTAGAAAACESCRAGCAGLCATGAGCAAEVSCQSACTSGPCSPKVGTCAIGAGVAAVGGTIALQQAIERPSGCNLVSEGAIGVAGMVASPFIVDSFLGTSLAACKSAGALPETGIDWSSGGPIIASACDAIVGTRFMSLLAQWIALGAVEGVPMDRSYLEVTSPSGGQVDCSNHKWYRNPEKYAMTFQDCNFDSLWVVKGWTETCTSDPLVTIHTIDINTNGDQPTATFKIKSVR